eukprot:COSAG02_NODE_2903_length_7776_cov_7.476618_5_plen_215_part_01
MTIPVVPRRQRSSTCSEAAGTKQQVYTPRVAGWLSVEAQPSQLRMINELLPDVASIPHRRRARAHACMPCDLRLARAGAMGLQPGHMSRLRFCMQLPEERTDIHMPQRHPGSETSHIRERAAWSPAQASFVRCICGVDKRQESSEDACRPCDQSAAASASSRHVGRHETSMAAARVSKMGVLKDSHFGDPGGGPPSRSIGIPCLTGPYSANRRGI